MGKKFSNMEETWSWKDVCWIAEHYKPVISSLLVNWNKPLANNWKLNTDRSFRPLINKTGAGGIVRNKNGDMLMAFAYNTQFCTNNFSEAQAVLIGHIQVSWKLTKIIEIIKKKMHQRNITITHCYRESNEVVDALAKYATTLQEQKIFLNQNDLPLEARGPLRMNKLQLANFRRKLKKHSCWTFDPS
ncbi:hypothetical protein RDI58_004179 [Solanum bulbocastanum]|uniref:RNase H type-1 domain-containing protein n=1 Tax=Solanum bulbocastanum TaxID=147425 RepID=A0AAN8U4Y3_SOLBU